MRSLRHAAVVLSALSVLNGCATRQAAPEPVAAAAPSDSSPARVTAASSRNMTDRNVITNAELAEFGGSSSSLFEFIRTRHSDWFRSSAASIARPTTATGATGGGTGTWATGSSSAAYPVRVFMDGQPFGDDPTVLRTVPLSQVAMARRLSPSQAQAKYGLNNNGGVIEVWTRLDRVR